MGIFNTYFYGITPRYIACFHWVGGIYILRNIDDVRKDISLVFESIYRLQDALSMLLVEEESLLAIEAGREAAAEIEAEQLIERIKK